MTVVRLHRNAPEAQNATKCAVCGTTDARQVTDHIQVGPPGTPVHDEGVCSACGVVLDHVVDKYGGELTVMGGDLHRAASGERARNHHPRRPSPGWRAPGEPPKSANST